MTKLLNTPWTGIAKNLPLASSPGTYHPTIPNQSNTPRTVAAKTPPPTSYTPYGTKAPTTAHKSSTHRNRSQQSYRDKVQPRNPYMKSMSKPIPPKSFLNDVDQLADIHTLIFLMISYMNILVRVCLPVF